MFRSRIFRGCITAGNTVDEAKNMASEALALHIEGLLADDAAIPDPSTLENVMADPDYAEGIAFLIVDAPVVKPKTVRVNITMPKDVLHRIDAKAKKRGMSRSSFLIRCALNKG